MMGMLGFNCKWIKGCLEYSSMSVLVNGSPTTEFISKKGLRQGDPLAPIIFLVTVEGLLGAIREAGRKVLLEGLKIGRNDVDISMLQFIDDIMFICKDNLKNVVTIK